MKTIFSYLTKCLLTYTLAFALVQVQVLLPVQNLKHSAGYAMAESVTKGDDGVAVKSGTGKMDSAESSVSMDLLTMLAMGFFTSRAVMICKPVPWDVMFAAGGGIIYIAGELSSWDAFKKMKSADSINYVAREDGDNEKQIEMLEAQKKGYTDVAKTAKTKAMIQTAAATAYGIAAILALNAKLQWFAVTTACAACVPTAPAIAQLELLDITLAPSKIKAPSLYAVCAEINASYVAGEAAVATTIPCTAAGTSCIANAAFCAKEVAICLPSAASIVDNDIQKPSNNLFQKLAKEGIQIPGFGTHLSEDMIEETYRESQFEELQDNFQIANFIERENPLYDLNEKLDFDNTNLKSQINSYVKNRDMSRYFQGELVSSTLDEYKSFKESMYLSSVNSNDSYLGDALELAFKNGVDLFIPSVHAGSMGTMLAGVLGIFLALFATTSQFIDTYLATPGWRSVAWGIGATLAFTAASATKEIQTKAEGNAEKIQKIIDKMNEFNSKSKQSLSGYNVGIPSKIPFPSTGNEPINLGDGKVPCPDSNNTSGCGSLKSGIEKNEGFASLGGNFGALAGSVGSAADGITGSGSIPGSAVDGLVNLSNNNSAIQKKLRQVQSKLNKSLKDAGKKPMDFDKLNKRVLAKLRKGTRNQLNKAGKSAGNILAAIGSGAPSGKEEKKEKVAAAKIKTPTIGGAVKAKKTPVFSLDLEENEGGNEGLSADEVLANQEAVDAMNEESQDDIVFNKEVSIFKVISVRYLKSGFDKLLEEEKPAAK